MAKIFGSCALTPVMTTDTACGSYLFNGKEYTQTGVYTDSFVSVFGCDSFSSVTLTVNHIVKPNISINGKVLGTTLPYQTYQWLLNGAPINGATGATYTVSANGDYKVAVMDANGCIDTSGVYTVTTVTGVANIEVLAQSISMHPNPAKDIVYIDAPIKINVAIMSIDGKIMLQQNDAKSMNISALSSGLYLIHITDTDGHFLRIEKLVKTGN